MERRLKKRGYPGSTSLDVTQREINHCAIARRAAAEGMVLLKNEGNVLPLVPGSRVALFGAGAAKTIKGGTGSGDVNERESVSILQGMRDAGFSVVNEVQVLRYDAAYDKARLDWRDYILKQTAEEGVDGMNFFELYTSHPFVAPAPAQEEFLPADAAFYILSRNAGEGADRYAAAGDYYLTDAEHAALARICSFYDSVIFVINAGGVCDLSFLDEFPNIRALLSISQPGMEGGHAFADVVSGAVNPSGRLTDTWAYRYEDYPNSKTFSHNNGNVSEEVYEEGIYVGYRYFDTFSVEPRFGFGFGLSYTTFSLACGAPERILIGAEYGVRVPVHVTNTGSVPGKEVVQLYVSCAPGKLQKEFRRLVAFAKTDLLQPGESTLLRLEFPLSALTSYDEYEPGWILEAGTFGIWVGNNLADSELVGALRLDKPVVITKTANICPPQRLIEEPTQKEENIVDRYVNVLLQVESYGLPVLEFAAAEFQTNTILYEKNAFYGDPDAKEFVKHLDTEDLIRLSAGDPAKGQGGELGAAGVTVPGSAGETHDCLKEQGVASIVLADGPAGLRLNQSYMVQAGKIIPPPFLACLEGGLFYLEEEQPGTKYYQFCTAIPVGTLLAQTWDTALIEEVGAMIGGEMELFGVTLWLAPGMCIHRNPLCGRNFEYYSEDPYLTGKMAASMTCGVQSVPGCGTTIKHFACNNQEDNRMASDSILTERTLREIYLRGFEIAIKESQPLAIMTSYNLINGVHSANNYDTCTKVARAEWGFGGLIMTDWTTTEVDEKCTASGCMRAGNDLIMPGSFKDYDNMHAELAAGTLSVEDLRACIARLISVVWRSNAYEEDEK